MKNHQKTIPKCSSGTTLDTLWAQDHKNTKKNKNLNLWGLTKSPKSHQDRPKTTKSRLRVDKRRQERHDRKNIKKIADVEQLSSLFVE